MAGATGAMTGFAYPEILVKVVSLFRAGDLDAAAEVFYRWVPLMRFEFQEGLGMAIRKEVLRRRGVLDCGDIRPPGAMPDAATMAALDRVLAWTERHNERRATFPIAPHIRDLGGCRAAAPHCARGFSAFSITIPSMGPCSGVKRRPSCS